MALDTGFWPLYAGTEAQHKQMMVTSSLLIPLAAMAVEHGLRQTRDSLLTLQLATAASHVHAET